MFESIGDPLSEIGPMMKNTMEDVLTGLFGDDLAECDAEELTDVEPVSGQYTLRTRTQMIIMNTWKAGHAKGDLVIQGVPGNSCRINCDNAKQMSVRQDAVHVVIQWAGGPLKIEVPAVVSSLKVRSTGGNIHLKQPTCPLNVKTLGGDLELFDVPKDFKAKTMGGNIALHLSQT